MGEKGVKRILAGAALALAVAACTSTPEPAAPPPATAPTAPAVVSLPPTPAKDQCGSAELQYLVGKPKTEIPVPVDPSRRRVACVTCPVTMEYRPDRVNILFDAQTGVIKTVKCG
jgi:hypothetical protein